MDGDPDVAGVLDRARIADPCTLVFGLPDGAPGLADPAGRAWSAAHWSHNARKAGHPVTPVDGDPPDGPTWCGTVDVDGLAYRIHRGLRRRQPLLWVRADGQEVAGFMLTESVWAEPVPVAADPGDGCPWCDAGPPDTLRHAADSDADGVYSIGAGEEPAGGGRAVVVQGAVDDDDPDFDTYCVVLEPGAHTHYGGVAECVLGPAVLRLRLTDAAARALDVPAVLEFALAMPVAEVEVLRAGLRRVLTSGRPADHPAVLQL